MGFGGVDGCGMGLGGGVVGEVGCGGGDRRRTKSSSTRPNAAAVPPSSGNHQRRNHDSSTGGVGGCDRGGEVGGGGWGGGAPWWGVGSGGAPPFPSPIVEFASPGPTRFTGSRFMDSVRRGNLGARWVPMPMPMASGGGWAGGSWGGFIKPKGNYLFRTVPEVENALADFPHVDVFVTHNSPRLGPRPERRPRAYRIWSGVTGIPW